MEMPTGNGDSGSGGRRRKRSRARKSSGEDVKISYQDSLNLKTMQNFKIEPDDPFGYPKADIAILNPSGRGKILSAQRVDGVFYKSFQAREEGKYEVSIALYGKYGDTILRNLNFNVAGLPEKEKGSLLPKRTREVKRIEPPKLPEEFKGENIKSWPNSSSYAQAFQNMKFSISQDYPDMRDGEALKNSNVKYTTYIYGSGNFGTVFKLNSQGNDYAVKCFTRASPGLAERYYYISYYISALKLPFLVGFQYLPKAVRLLKDPGQYYPVLKMEWISGTSLNEYITSNLKDSAALKNVANSILDGINIMQKNGLAHGDLSGDNILVTSAGKMMLIDYDGMYVPPFEKRKAPEKGHDNFQHPKRNDHYSPMLDNFSLLLIYTSLTALAANPDLWEYNGGDGDKLIFSVSDFNDPDQSELFKDLQKIGGKTQKLTKLIKEALKEDPLWQGSSPAKIKSLK